MFIYSEMLTVNRILIDLILQILRQFITHGLCITNEDIILMVYEFKYSNPSTQHLASKFFPRQDKTNNVSVKKID